ncbi:MAG: hypothetical protein HY076_03250, partial [Candidatus Eisenbacteria bacterium]|nr:hypothetical protein [Candidatus Eisenbacteria bacterium]
MTRVRVLIVPVLLTALTWAAFIGDRAPGTSAARDGFPLDDAWIHMVYARSLAREGGFHYNPGVPEAGMTSPLWVIALAPVHLITHDDRAAVMGAKILSLVSGMVSVAALGLLAFELGESAPVAVAVATLAALDPALTFARTSGMEPALFTALVLLALTFACRGRALAAALCCGLGVLARPEGVLVAPALAFLLATAKPRLTIARGAAAAALAAL